MNTRTNLSLGALLLLGACGTDGPEISEASEVKLTPDPSDIVGHLVDRFDAEACRSASPLGMMGKNGAEGIETVRTYAVDSDCLTALEQALVMIGFTEGEHGVYDYTSSRGWWEKVTVSRSDEGNSIGIQWEEFNQ